MYKRPTYQTLLKRLKEPRRFRQVLAGPRQVGKTTLVQQVLKDLPGASHYASADETTSRDLQLPRPIDVRPSPYTSQQPASAFALPVPATSPCHLS